MDLNRERAIEEAKGIVRWLRPEFQAPQACAGVGTQMGLDGMETRAGEGTVEAEKKDPAPWPKDVPSQLRAVRDLFLTRTDSSTLEEVAHLFKGARRDAVRRQLDALEGLGILTAYEDVGFQRRWSRGGGHE